MTCTELYERLFAAYGPQGWWPLIEVQSGNPTKTGSVRGYHPGDFSYPRTARQRFEIGVGAVLTQNTAWTHAERALLCLDQARALEPERLLEMSDQQLHQAVFPAGCYRAKSRKLRCLAQFYLSHDLAAVGRDEILAVWGVGPETADSIMLYACGRLHFVIDAYARRIFEHLHIAPATASYRRLKDLCESQLPPRVDVYQEFHALLVEHAKRCYARKPFRDWVCGETAL